LDLFCFENFAISPKVLLNAVGKSLFALFRVVWQQLIWRRGQVYKFLVSGCGVTKTIGWLLHDVIQT